MTIHHTPRNPRFTEKTLKQATAEVSLNLSNGAGYLADSKLRYFLSEYNNRIFSTGNENFPNSAMAMRDFFSIKLPGGYWLLRPEKDILFDFEDFVDYSTSEESSSHLVQQAMKLDEGVIYNFNATTDPRALLFASSDGFEFGFGSASLIRSRDTVSVMLIGGELYDPQEAKDLCESMQQFASMENFRGIPIHERGARENAIIELTPGLWQTLAISRINLVTEEVETRALFRDHTLSHSGHFIDYKLDRTGDWTKINETAEQRFREKATIFDLVHTSLLLPSYLQKKYRLVKEQKVRTEFGRKESRRRSRYKHTDPHGRIRFRTVLSLTEEVISHKGHNIGRSYTPPQFKVNVEGYWRRLKNAESVGKDRFGQPVKGKTWVNAHERYKDRPSKEGSDEPRRVIYIKQTLRYAKAKLHGYAVRQEKSSLYKEPLPSSEGSNLYVMLNPAMLSNIYKVGYTDLDPEERARQLSAHTGVLGRFIVIQSWRVSHGREAEAAAHEALDDYRASEDREFFQLPYEKLRQMVEKAIVNFRVAIH